MKTCFALLVWSLLLALPSVAQNSEADKRLLSSESASERARAACRLADMDKESRDAMDPLIALLGDDTPVAWDVCRGIGRRGDGRWFGNGMNCNKLGCDPTTPGRQAAAALMQMDSDAVPKLEKVLVSGVPHARRNAAWVLGAIGLERSVDPLTRALGDDHDPVREQAAWALGAIGESEGVAPLVRSLRDSNPEVRENAAWALGAIGDDEATLGLIRALGDDVADVRENVAWALGAIGDERAIDALIKVFEDDDNNDVRRNAIWALRAIY